VEVTLIEIVFAVVATGIVMMVVFIIRSGMDRRRQAEQARVCGDDDSGSGILVRGDQPVTLVKAPENTGWAARLDRWFGTAVGRSGLDASPTGVVALMGLMGLVGGVALYLWKGRIGLAMFGVAVGVAIPFVVIAFMQRRFKRKLQDQLPDALYMLAGGMRAGQTIDQAIQLVADRGNKPLADEFKHTAGLLKLGMTPAAALKATADRVDLLDFHLIASTVGLYSQTGGNLATLLDRLAASVRDRNQFRGQFMATTAQARVVATVMAAAVPLFLLAYILFEPEHVQGFFESPGGWTLMIGCLVMELIGLVWVWRLFRVQY
jgi:tight adherence protein B